MKLKALAIIPLILLLTACGITEGYITKRHHEPAYTYVQMICAAYNKDGGCSAWMPLTQYVPDSYHFSLKDGDDAGYVVVTEEEYDQYEVGQYYPAKR